MTDYQWPTHEARDKAARAARGAYPTSANIRWRAMDEAWRNEWRKVADAVAATIPEPTPQPIDPADVRVGDRVRQVETYEGVVFDLDFGGAIYARDDDGGALYVSAGGDDSTRLYLLDRPDPDAELVERVANAIHNADVAHAGIADVARAALAAIRKTHTIEPRPATGDLHA